MSDEARFNNHQLQMLSFKEKINEYVTTLDKYQRQCFSVFSSKYCPICQFKGTCHVLCKAILEGKISDNIIYKICKDVKPGTYDAYKNPKTLDQLKDRIHHDERLNKI